MKIKITKLVLFVFLVAGMLSCSKTKEVQIINESPVLQEQAEILRTYLEEIYPDYSFTTSNKIQSEKEAIVLNLDPNLESEAFAATPKKMEDGQLILTISAGSQSGIHYAVFKLLEELGCGFFLSFEQVQAKTDKLNLAEIQFSDKPLSKERFVFNWHNFLSGCSSWDLEEWKHYIDQSAKMRYNGLMTHLYADDPSTVFSHNGVCKKGGYMPNTQTGRQYGTQQVNDVRRLIGGEVFDSPVFGSEASKVPDDARVNEAKELVKEIHNYASKRFMDVWYGFDIDYAAANPREILFTLPESAKIKVKRNPSKYGGSPYPEIYLPIPDSPEGIEYYRSQVTQIFKDYPEIDNLVVWTRGGGSPFLTLKYDEFPQRWKTEFDALAALDTKYDKKNKDITGRFATAKVYKTILKCMKELGKGDVKLWAGSWRHTWLEYANWFYPEEIGFIPLDQGINFFTDQQLFKGLIDVSKERELIPVVWAHHDDRAYVGSPYIPYEDLQSKIDSLGSTGLGVIHWTTKPLDIYFKNTELQAWGNTKNHPLESTAGFMSQRLVSPVDADAFGKYLTNWVNEGPRFGRETRTWFMDEKIEKEEYEHIIEGCENRIKLLEGLKEQDNLHIQYFKKLEAFCAVFYHTEYSYQQALQEARKGNYKEATALMEKCDPAGVIEKYTEASKINGVSKGEKGIILEMNLSWKPFLSSLNQTLGKEKVFYNFGKVNYPDFVIGVLNTNFFIDSEQKLWRNYGEDETKGKFFSNAGNEITADNAALAEICADGIESKETMHISLKPIAYDISPGQLECPDFFKPGKYELTLIFNEHEYSGEGSRIFELEVSHSNEPSKTITETIDIFKEAGGKNKVLTKTFPISLESKDNLQIVLKSKKGTCLINGLILRPLATIAAIVDYKLPANSSEDSYDLSRLFFGREHWS
jgi:hypothetical protein